jgi:hypothetical protein
MVNPYAGDVLGLRDHEKSFARWVHLVHTRFDAGETDEKMVGGFSVAMLVERAKTSSEVLAPSPDPTLAENR